MITKRITMRQMRTDLVGAASDQLHFQQGQPSADG